MVADGFEWDDEKADANLGKHGVSFEEALTVVRSFASLTDVDDDHSENEPREWTIGRSEWGRVLVVSHTDRGGNVRIISAREATGPERRAFEDHMYG